METSSDHCNAFRKEGNWTLNQPYEPAFLNEIRARYNSLLVENTLNFKKEFDRHTINLLVGQTCQSIDYERMWGSKRNILKNAAGDYYPVLDNGNEAQLGGYREEAVILSYLGRLEYSYADKYLFNAVLRRDGTSRFGKNNRWGNFPSVSSGWRINEEEFFQVPFLSDLKLRASYGTLGSSNIGYWDYIPTINVFPTIVMGRGEDVLNGATQVKHVNTDLRWETLTQTNFGIDFGFL